MNVLVLGANGYLGSKIVHALANKEMVLVCTKREKSDLSRLDDLLKRIEIKFIPATIEAVEASAQFVTFDWVLNIACAYERRGNSYNSVIEANMKFPLEVLNAVAEKGTKKFLTIGTGLPDYLNMYSFSKKVFGEFGSFYVEKFGIDFFNLKLEMFYGSDEPGDRFIPHLIKEMLRGNEVNVTLGTQHRDIIAIGDVENAVLKTMLSEKKGYWEIPVGTGIAPTVSEIVDFIWDETGKKSKVNKGAVPMRTNEADCVADTSVINEICEWSPIDWKSGIRKMICDIREKEKEKVCNENFS